MKLLGWNDPISAHPHIIGDHATKSNQNADLFVHKRMARNIQKTNIRRTQYSDEAMLRHKTTEVRHTHLHIHIDIRHTLEPWFTWRWRGCDLPTRGSLLLFTSSIMGITLACKLPLHEKACLTRLAQNTRKFRSQISDHETHKNHKAPIQIIRLTKITRPP